VKYRVIVRPEAEDDLKGAFSWYEDNRVGLGYDFLLQVNAGLNFIMRNPEIHLIEYKGTRKHIIKRFPYKIIYLIAKGLLWPMRLLPIQDTVNKVASYPPSQPITFKSGNLEMILRCNDETQGPEIFIYIRDGQLLTDIEHDKIRDRIMKGSFDSEFAKVKLQLNANPTRVESWEIDLTGQIISPLKPHIFLTEMRNASFLEVNISRGEFHYSGHFLLKNKIPPHWVPCGGREAK